METGTRKKKIVRVVLDRAEGPSALCRGPIAFEGKDPMGDADAQLLRWAYMRKHDPQDSGLGYDKIDFTIEWSDGEKYDGRYDLQVYGKETDEGTMIPSIGKHIQSFIRYISGYWLEHPELYTWTKNRTIEQYRKYIGLQTAASIAECKEFLRDYDLGLPGMERAKQEAVEAEVAEPVASAVVSAPRVIEIAPTNFVGGQFIEF